MSLDTKNAFAALNVKGSKSKSSSKEGKSDKADSKKLSKKALYAAEKEKQAALEASLFGGSGAAAASNWADELDEEDDFETSGNGGDLAPLPDDWATEVTCWNTRSSAHAFNHLHMLHHMPMASLALSLSGLPMPSSLCRQQTESNTLRDAVQVLKPRMHRQVCIDGEVFAGIHAGGGRLGAQQSA